MEKPRILIVDDTPANLLVLNELLQNDYRISVATNGPDALEAAFSEYRPDLILLDVMMPEMDGFEVIKRLKAHPGIRHIPVLFVTARHEIEDEEQGLSLGAADYITKPIKPPVVQARVKAHMKLHMYRQHLEDLVSQRTEQLRQGYIETVHRLTRASEFKDEETGTHIKRISYYTRHLSETMGMDAGFCQTIFYVSPMHDIGKVGIPDSVLCKQGPLTEDEWKIMKTHTGIGAQILEGSDSPYLTMALDIARSHHERWDGTGYPDGLKKEQIPKTARIMNICDQYDALRSKRPYKPGFDHGKTVDILTRGDGRTMPDHFDPEVLEGFKKSMDQFEEIFETHKD